MSIIKFEKIESIKTIDLEMPHGKFEVNYDVNDGALLDRLMEAKEAFEHMDVAENYKLCKSCVDYIFNAEIQDKLLNGMHPMTIVKQDKVEVPVIYLILEAIIPELTSQISRHKKQSNKQKMQEFLNNNV